MNVNRWRVSAQRVHLRLPLRFLEDDTDGLYHDR